jgi:transcriptional regulator of heat shock response
MIMILQTKGNTVWLRTRHTDHHRHNSSFIQIRDAFNADAITNNPSGARDSVTKILDMFYRMHESDYYSYACTVASALSNGAENVTFEKELLFHPARKGRDQLQEREEQQRARDRLLKLMDIVFSNLREKKSLMERYKPNIYR